MKNITKRILAALIVVAMLALVTACGKSSTEDNKNSANTENSKTDNNDSTDTKKDEQKQEDTSGGDTAKTEEPEATPTTEPAPEPSFDPETAFDGLGVFPHGNIVLTGWELKAGMVLGIEDLDPAINSYLDANGGLVNLVFLSETEAVFTNGTESLNGTYEVLSGQIYHLTFEGREFYAGYAITEFDWDVLWVIDMAEPENLYPFIYIDEH